MDKPIIKAYEQNDSMEFEINGDYRSVSMKIHPQLLIQYRNKVILSIYLMDYYKNEFLQFNTEGKCSAQKQYEEYVGSLQRYLKEKIVRKVSDEHRVDIKEELQIYVSSVGGVSYVNNKEKLSIDIV